MSIVITDESKAAYTRYLDEVIDTDLHGSPTLRRHTAPYNSSEFAGLVDFAAGWQGGRESIFGTPMLRTVAAGAAAFPLNQSSTWRTGRSGNLVRVCQVSDAECSRNCNIGPCANSSARGVPSVPQADIPADASPAVQKAIGRFNKVLAERAAGTLLLELARAAVRYDEAIQACANDPDAMSSYCTAEGDTLDMLYADWINKARAVLESSSAAGVQTDGGQR